MAIVRSDIIEDAIRSGELKADTIAIQMDIWWSFLTAKLWASQFTPNPQTNVPALTSE
jgi:hypothetical protein